ncbi:predicted protein [Arabidopsis lyrata subsp. lyrata]|uniref:Predicted protein n=1 Tax=Arabidopsis lyrata subsp. lyrata TaxID=81972 RepID=D7M657_ARALL|nr:predicted protein [Arabidopsis lyrata subsp. lyrata]
MESGWLWDLAKGSVPDGPKFNNVHAGSNKIGGNAASTSKATGLKASKEKDPAVLGSEKGIQSTERVSTLEEEEDSSDAFFFFAAINPGNRKFITDDVEVKLNGLH